MQIGELASLLVDAQLIGDASTEVTSITSDSRTCQQGALFICLLGTNCDGHDYAQDAVNHGATAIVCRQRLKNIDVPMLLVEDTRFAMAVIASHFYEYPSRRLKLIGVTGTNGKTTISHMIEQVLVDAGMHTGMIGTIYTKIGLKQYTTNNTTPDCIELQQQLRTMVDDGVQYCVTEVSSHALALGRVKGCHFRTAVLSNVTQDHLDYHQTMEHYRWAKGLLFSRMGNDLYADKDKRQYVVLNADDPASVYYKDLTAVHTLTYGIHQPAHIQASQIRISDTGTSFLVDALGEKMPFQLKLIGRFSVYNALAAIAVCLLEGIELQQIRQSLEHMHGVQGRFESIQAGQDFTVLVDYAHTPDSLENVLATISEFAKGRIFCVFGCGGNRDRAKRPLMADVAARYSDYVTITSDNPRWEDPEAILDDIEAGLSHMSSDSYVRITDRKQAIEHTLALAQQEDVVLIAGKGHETYQEIQGVRFPFDDRIEAQKAIRSIKS